MPSLEEAMRQSEDGIEQLDDELITPVNDVFMINPETRVIEVPESERLFGVNFDKDVEKKYFKCPKIVGNNIDLSKHKIYVVYQKADENITTVMGEVGKYWCEDVKVDETGDYIEFSWLLSGNVLREQGFIAFKVVAVYMDTETGNVITRWNTIPAYGTVKMTLSNGEEITEQYADVITQLLQRMNAVEDIATPEAIQGYVEQYLNQHPIELDETLTDSKKAAPANLVGQLKDDLAELSDSTIGKAKQLDFTIDSAGHGFVNVNLKANVPYYFKLNTASNGTLNFFTNSDLSTGYFGDSARFDKYNDNFVYTPTSDVETLYIMCYAEKKRYDFTVKEILYNDTVPLEYFKKRHGELDDTKLITRAISNLNKVGKKVTLLFEPKRYLVSSVITPSKYISMNGNGCVLYANQTDMSDIIIRYPNQSNSDYCTPIIEEIVFDGGNSKHNVSGLEINLSGTKVRDCRFMNCKYGFVGKAICDVEDCTIWDNKIGLLLNYTESYISNIHGQSYIGIQLNGEGYRIDSCKLHGDGTHSETNCGIYVTGSRNVISGCYIDQWKVAGIIIDSSKSNFLSNGNKAIGGAYQNVINGNYFYNNGSGEYNDSLIQNPNHNTLIYGSAGIILKTVPKTGKTSLEENSITNNVFGTGYFKGWSEEGTSIIATKVGIHLCGCDSNTIFDNFIASNKFDKDIGTKILYYNVSENENYVELNV